MGFTSITTDTAGVKVSEMRYKPWGEVRYTWKNSDPAVIPSAYALTRYTYTSQYSYMDDPSTSATEGFGLMFYNARWYDPALGRMAQADSVVPAGVQGYDRYAYNFNNPIKYTDPSGHDPILAGALALLTFDAVATTAAELGVAALAVVLAPEFLIAVGVGLIVAGAVIAYETYTAAEEDNSEDTGITEDGSKGNWEDSEDMDDYGDWGEDGGGTQKMNPDKSSNTAENETANYVRKQLEKDLGIEIDRQEFHDLVSGQGLDKEGMYQEGLNKYYTGQNGQ
ncbi:MAG TPA: RHS repeat-associated core domain-containing protein [Anaerolineales bacterium]|nr:RHS repeat-associated core domain-containing protein [Anaerolineales bacterium]